MKSQRIVQSIKSVLYFIAFAIVLVACDNNQGMMNGGGTSMNPGNWNWIQILIGIIIGFLIGYLLPRRKK